MGLHATCLEFTRNFAPDVFVTLKPPINDSQVMTVLFTQHVAMIVPNSINSSAAHVLVDRTVPRLEPTLMPQQGLLKNGG